MRPVLNIVDLTEKDSSQNGAAENRRDKPPEVKDHRQLKVRSVIDIHAWDQARWRGTAYAQYPSQPPCMAFLFEDREGATKIFERWQERFGTEDEKEEISLSIIRQLPDQNEHHYCILITASFPKTGGLRPDQIVTVATRSLILEPNDDVNLERFLDSYRRVEAFYLMPAVLNDASAPEFLPNLAILKRNLAVKLADEVKEHDIEVTALRHFDRKTRPR